MQFNTRCRAKQISKVEQRREKRLERIQKREREQKRKKEVLSVWQTKRTFGLRQVISQSRQRGSEKDEAAPPANVETINWKNPLRHNAREKKLSRIAWVVSLSFHALLFLYLAFLGLQANGSLFLGVEELPTQVSDTSQPQIPLQLLDLLLQTEPSLPVPPAEKQKPIAFQSLNGESIERPDSVLIKPHKRFKQKNEKKHVVVAKVDSSLIMLHPADSILHSQIDSVSKQHLLDSTQLASESAKAKSDSLFKADSIAKVLAKAKTKTNSTSGGKVVDSRTMRRVKKVYPLALEAQRQLVKLKASLDSLPSNSSRRHLIKATERELMRRYMDTVLNMTTKEGIILAKLIARQTGQRPYDLIKEYRGSVRAAFFQALGSFWDVDLKVSYDTLQNQDLENAISIIESQKKMAAPPAQLKK